MPRTRSAANASLYRARILLQSWEAAKEGNRHEERLLTEAFLPAVQAHLLAAYGWYLLAVSGIEESSLASPPLNTSELDPPEAGRALAPELREFSALEKTGWLAQVLTAPEELLGAGGADRPSVHRNNSTLLGSDREAPGYAVVGGWEKALRDVMTRMDDSLQES